MAEERLSWFTTDPEMKRSIFVPDNLSEGKEENRVLPWVFHDDENKQMELKCIMRGYNVSNNPSDYKEARWSHPGFSDSQVDTSVPADIEEENGDPYAIWTIKISMSKADAGKKWVTCEFQQGDFPLSTDFTFLIFRKMYLPEEQKNLTYDFGGFLNDKDVTQQVEDDIKRQISEHYSMPASGVARDGQNFLITLDEIDDPPPIEPVVIETDPTTPTSISTSTTPATPSTTTLTVTPLERLSNFLAQIVNLLFFQSNPFYQMLNLFTGPINSIENKQKHLSSN